MSENILNEEQADEYYRLLGKYIINFNNVIYNIQDFIEEKLKDKGLNYFEIYNYFYSDTATPLLNKWITLIKEEYCPNTNDLNKIFSIYNGIDEQIKFRNFLIHGETLFCINDPKAKIIQMKLYKRNNRFIKLWNDMENSFINDQLDKLDNLDDLLDDLTDYYREIDEKIIDISLLDYLEINKD